MSLLILATGPLFLVFEAWQLVIAERYLGIKYINGTADPRRLGPAESIAFLWSSAILAYWLWMLLALVLGEPSGRAQLVAMLAVSVLGFTVRRNCGLKWILVTLTLEGAVRIGMLVSLLGTTWHHL